MRGRVSVVGVRAAKLAERAVSSKPSTRTEEKDEPKAPAHTAGTRFTLPLPIRRKAAARTSTASEADNERLDSATASPERTAPGASAIPPLTPARPPRPAPP